MKKPWVVGLQPASFPVRIMAAMLSCISVSLITVLIDYVPVAERMDNTSYYPFWYSWIITALILLAIVIFLTLPLSLFADAVSLSLARRFRGIPMQLGSKVIGYVLLAGISGVLFSVFVFRGNTFLYTGAIRQICILTLIFLGWQYILQAGSYWLKINMQAKTG